MKNKPHVKQTAFHLNHERIVYDLALDIERRRYRPQRRSRYKDIRPAHLVPQQGSLHITTEFGRLDVAPKEIAVVQRGMKFKVDPLEKSARGYILENYGEPFILPHRGPIGANGLANSRDFETPLAWFEDVKAPYQIVCRFGGELWATESEYSPFDVVGWHGNYAPYKYDLTRFNMRHDPST